VVLRFAEYAMGKDAEQVQELFGAYSYFYGVIIIAGMENFLTADDAVFASSLVAMYTPLREMPDSARTLKRLTENLTPA
jgi:hypothetical protein